MHLQTESFRRRLGLLAALSFAVLLALMLGTPPDTVTGQTDCSSYNQCTELQGESSMKLTGNLTYSFDEASLNALLPTDADRQAFRTNMINAANDWAQRTGRSITQAPAGQAGNVTLRVNNDQQVRDGSGLVRPDPADSSRRIIDISNEWPGYSPEGQQRLTKHEWGHVLGLPDVPTPNCSNASTVMR